MRDATFLEFISKEENSYSVERLFRNARDILEKSYPGFGGLSPKDKLIACIKKMHEIYVPADMYEYLVHSPSTFSFLLRLASNRIGKDVFVGSDVCDVEKIANGWEKIFNSEGSAKEKIKQACKKPKRGGGSS